ncbi:MAG: hypothetical protein DMC57_10015 [Verrucomicrobia bacterium]|nr:MAG: hypothetical protein DMC57_10015 [Verrucomicrobiota bacterium]
MSPRVAIRIVSFLSVILGSAVSVPAAQLKEAQVTQVVKDVKLLPTGAAARPASVSDEVREGTAVRTGVDSRSELKFSDQTLARLGAKTCRMERCCYAFRKERAEQKSVRRR